jgi:autotransporter-associated beta strand protein
MIGAGSLVVNANNTGAFTGVWNASAGTLAGVGPGSLAGQPINLNGGNLSLLWDGTSVNAGANLETAAYNNAVTMFTTAATITVDRALISFAPLSQTSANKTMQLASLTLTQPNSTLSVTNNNGNGLAITGALALPLTGVTTFSVSTANASPVVQGLAFNGAISGGNTGAANVVLAKTGAGTLVLSNAGNSFGGGGSIVDIVGGILQVPSNGVLGEAGNVVRISTNSATAGLRATGTFSTGRTINLNAAANGIDVTDGNTFTITAPFTFGTGGVTNALAKNDNGVLDLNANNPTWTGVVTINDGALRVSNAGALGVAANNTVVAGNTSLFGSALQLNGVSIAELLTLNGTGLNTTGALQAVAGTTNTESGAITLATASAIGADTTSTLNLTGGISGAFGLTLAGAGNININTVALGAVTGLTKLNAGTTTIGVASPLFVGALTLNGGAFVVGSAGLGSIGGTGAITLSESATLRVDDSGGTAVTNRLGGGRAITMQAGATTLEYVTNTTGTSSETLGALTVGTIGGATIKVTNNGTQTSTLTFASLNAVNAYTLNFLNGGTGTGFGTATNKIVFTAAPTLVGGAVAATNGLLARATVNGIDFATYNTDGTTTNAFGVQAYAAYQNSVSINAAAVLATDTFRISSATTNSTISAQTRTLNALKFDGSTNLTLDATGSGSASSTLTLTSGGVLAAGGGNHSVGGSLTLAFGGNEAYFHVNTGTSLTINGSLTGTVNLEKALGGTLNLNAPSYFTGFTVVNGGLLKLAPGGTNTLFPNANLFVATGATLDLNGGVQFVGDLASQGGAGVGSTIGGGIITTTGGSATLLANVNTSARRFAGQITGDIFFARTNGSATAQNLVLSNDNTYTGGTLIMGGISAQGVPGGVVLVDGGRLSGNGPITINFGTLSLNNFGTTDLLDRVNDNSTITLNAGAINYNGRAGAISSEMLGPVTLASGASTISSANSSQVIAPQASTLTLTSLTRTPGSGATIEFALNHTGSSQATLGSLGASSTNILVTGGVPLNNNLVGPWAVVHTSFFNQQPVEFASYSTSLGIGALNQAGFAGYDAAAFPATNQPAQNIRLAAGAAIPTGGIIINSLNDAGTGASTNFNLTFAAAADLLNLASGGLIVQGVNNTSTIAGSIGTAALPGRITAGGANPAGTTELDFLYYNTAAANTLTVNSAIVDNPNGQLVRLVAWGANIGTDFGAATIILASNANNWNGGTIVNQETIQIGAAGTPGNLPGGGLTINGGVVTLNNGTIASQAVTMNGNATLTLIGTNSLTRLSLNSSGGNAIATPAVATGTLLNLSANGTTSTTAPIYAQSSNPGSVPTISGTALDFGSQLDSGSNNKVTLIVDPVLVNGQSIAPLTATLAISAPLQGVGTGNSGLLNKLGNGNLQLSGASLFSGGVMLNNGGIILGASSTPSTGQSAVISGPLGTGTLTAASGTSLLASTAVTISNPLVLQGNLVFNGASNMTFNGALTLPGSAYILNVANPVTTVSLLGQLTGGGGALTKTGLGSLVIPAVPGSVTYNGGNLGIATDGDGTGTANVVSMGGITSTGMTTITVGKAGTVLFFPNAANKTVRPASFSSVGLVQVINSNGFGLDLPALTLSADETFGVTNATASNVVQGLTVSGVLSGAFNIVKTGAGALALTNSGNTFGGGSNTIDIQGGILSVNSDGAFGNATNVIKISTNLATGAGLRFTGGNVYNVAHTINLNAAANAIEVAVGTTATLTSPFAFSAAGNTLAKNDNGVLAINANNSGYSGVVTINQGAILLMTSNGLGTGAINVPLTVVQSGSGALQLSGSINVANAINIGSGVTNANPSGLNSGGTVESVAGVNTLSGLLTNTTNNAFFLGADVGATLNIGNVASVNSVTLNGGGTVNFTQATLPTFSSFNVIGGTAVNITGNTGATFTPSISVRNGTLAISGTGVKTGPTGAITVSEAGILTLDDTGAGAATVNRLNNRALTLDGGGTFNYKVNGGAASSEVSTGAFAINSGGNTINIDTSAGVQNSTLTWTSFTPGAGSSLNLTGTFGTANNKITFTTAPTLSPVTTGIQPRTTTNGNEFATYTAAAGFLPFTGYSPQTDITLAGATETYKAGAVTGNTLAATQTINALTLSGGSVDSVSGVIPTTLTLTAGAILNQAGNNNLDVDVIGLAAVEGVVHVASGTTLTASSGFFGAGGMTKALPGTLVLTRQQFVSGSTTVNGGTLKLSSGVANTLLFNNGLVVNSGGTLDLAGRAQYIGSLSSQAAGAGLDAGGGTITSSLAGNATLVANNAAAPSTFGGTITGTATNMVSLVKANTAGTLVLVNANPYFGSTIVAGGALTLQDRGSLANTSALDLNYATLNLTNTGLFDMGDRVNNAAPVTMRGGTLNYLGRAQTASSEALNSLSIAQGSSQITFTLGGTGVNSAELSFTNLTRSNSATLNVSTTGLIGNNARLLFSNINGISTGAVGGGLVNNIVGGWLLSNGVDLATYVPGLGLAPLGAVGAAAYDGTALPAAGGGTLNIKLSSASFAVPDINAGVAGTYFLNSLAYVGTVAGQTLSFTDANDTLNLTSGGFAKSGNFTSLIGSAVGNGKLTAGGSVSVPGGVAELILHSNLAALAMTVNSAIVDNAASGDAVRFVNTLYSGATTTLLGNNTYSGGTVVNAGNSFTGTLNIGATGTLPAGGLTINTATVTQTAGGVITPQAVTINGQGTLTLTGNNTLTSLTFNNNGGGNSTVTPGVAADTLKLTGGINSNPSNVGGIATIGTGNLDLNGNNSFPVNVAATLINGADVAPWQSGLTINSVVVNGGIAKAGAGMLQLGGASTFAGGVMVNGGGLVLALDSTPSTSLATVTSGPLGTGTLTMASGTSLVATAARTIANNVVFQGIGTPGATVGSTFFNGTSNLTLNGNTTLPNTWNATITAPQMTVSIPNVIGSLSTDVINKSGLGVLTLTGTYNGTLQAAGGVSFLEDGNLLGTVENVVIGSALAANGNIALTLAHSNSAPNAFNKILQNTTLSIGANTLAVTNSNGYGLEFTGTTTLTGTPSISVANPTASNVVQGLTLSGPVTGAGFGLTKVGTGTLVLSNAANDFGGAGSVVEIRKGVLSINSDGALGDSANSVSLNVNGATLVGLRSTGTFTTNRVVTLNQLSNAIEVTQGNVFTIGSGLTVPQAATLLTKNDNGVLNLAGASTATWNGGLTINAGAVRLSNSGAAGASTNPIIVNAAVGAALHLSGSVTIPNPLKLNNVANNVINGGLNGAGNLESVAGVNNYTGLMTTVFDALIGADSGSTLNINGGIDDTGNRQLTFVGAGTINLNSAVTVASPAQVNKYGSGTLNITTAQTIAFGTVSTGTGIQINGGTLSLNQAGTLGVATVGILSVHPGATLELNDNSVTPIGNRLANSVVRFLGGNMSYIGNTAANSTETISGGPAFNRGYAVVTVTAAPAFQANLLWTGASNAAANAQNNATGPAAPSVLFRGSNLGTAAGSGIATIQDSGGTTGFSFNGATGGTGTNTKGLIPWALIDTAVDGTGVSFATGDSAAAATGTLAILRPLAANEMATDTAFAASVNERLTGNRPVTTAVTPNSLTLEANGQVTISQFIALNFSSGGILARAGNSGIGGGIINQVNTLSPLEFWVPDVGGNLTVSSLFSGGNGTANGAVGTVKAGVGSLTLSTPVSAIPGLATSLNTMSGQTVINQGTIVLAGGKNTLQANNYLEIGLGGTLDLNGNSQQVFGFFTDGVANGGGGTVTSTSGVGNLVVNADNASRPFAGSIAGGTVASGNYVNFTRSGLNTLTFYSPNTYSGTTLINGGTTVLRDNASFSNTSSIDINYATLTVDNSAGTIDLPNRINDAATITLRGGTLTIQGRPQAASSEAFGAVVIAEGFDVLNPNVGATGVNSMDVALASLSHPAGSTGTLIVQGTNLGTIGSNSRVTVTTLNGVATTALTYSANGSGLTNNIVGGWAESTTNEFLTYIPGLGLAPLNQTGAAQYDFTTIPAGNNATKNARIGATTAVPNGGATLNALSVAGASNVTFTTGTDTLNLTSGGLIGPNANQLVGGALDSGRITAGGLTPGANSDLYVYNRLNTLTLNSRFVDNTNGGGSSVRLVATGSGGGIVFPNVLNSYTGGTVINGGTISLNGTSAAPVIPAAAIPANGFVVNGAIVNMNGFAGQIASSNVVTLSGGSGLTMFGNNTLAGLVFNNNGNSGATGFLTTYTTTANPAAGGARGVLTLGSAGLVVTSSNVTTFPVIEGRIDFGASPNTMNIGSIDAGVADIAPLQPSFVLRGIVGSAGGITKSGNGVVQLNAQAAFTGPLTVTAGGIKNGVTNAGSRYSALTLGTNTRYDLNGVGTTWGSLTGAGTVFSSNFAAIPTLAVGFDNTDTTFSGHFQRYSDLAVNMFNLHKIGSGTMSLTGVQSTATASTGTFTISGGALAFSGAGAWFTGTTAPALAETFTVNAGASLIADNSLASGMNVNNRLGLNATGTLNLQGGTLWVKGNGNDATTAIENVTTFNVVNGYGTLTLTADAGSALSTTITTLSTENASGSALFRGISGAAAGSGVATLAITTPNLIGGQGATGNGTSTMGVRRDIIADASPTGLGTGFLVKDSGTLLYRALGGAAGLASTEYNTVPTTWAATQNAGINGGSTVIGANTTANTLSAAGTSSLDSGLNAGTFGIYGASGLLNQGFTINAVLVQNGGTLTTNVGSLAGTVGTSWAFHTIGTAVMNVNSYYGIANVGGFEKAGDGTLNLNKPAFITGAIVVDGGTLNLNSGQDNTLPAIPGVTAPALLNLAINGPTSVVDLKGKNQALAVLSSNNLLPGQTGGIVNSGATMATLTVTGTGTFGGQIGGGTVASPSGDNLGFTRAGNTTTTLTNANTYSGPTNIRGGILQLRDSGAIPNTSAVNIDYATLLVDNFGLNPIGVPNPVRISPATPVNLLGGFMSLNGAGSTDNTLTINTLNVNGGGNQMNLLPQITEGSTATITIGNLVRNPANHSMVTFVGFINVGTNNAAAAVSTIGGQGLNADGNIFLNQINGTPFTAANLTNKLIGGWAVADGNTFATYVDGAGVSVMGQTTVGIVAPAFDGADVSLATTASQNISDGTARTLATGAHAANSWRFIPGAAITNNLSTGATVALGVGIITNAAFAITIQGTDATNTLTSPNSDLYVYVNQNTTSINTKITGALALVKGGGATMGLGSPTSGAVNNDYTLGTYVQQGAVTLNGAAGSTIIPAGPAGAGLVISNATVTQNTNAQQIAATTDVVINGGGTLNLAVGANTLNSVTFNNAGGIGNPSLAVGAGALTLSAATPLSAVNDSFATTPVVSGAGGLILSNTAPVISVSGLSTESMQISAVISSTGGAVSKMGAGALVLSGASTFGAGFNLNEGTLIMGVGSTGAVTNGPVGTGTLTIADGTTVFGATTVTVANPTTINGNFSFGGVTAVNNLTLSGAMNLGAVNRTITVTSPAVTATIGGALTSTNVTGASFTKDGPGFLVLSAANTVANFGSGSIAVAGGILRNGIDNALPLTTPLVISGGAGYDLNAFNQALLSITGSGFITNSGAAKTLTLGGSNATDVATNVDTTFGGAFVTAVNNGLVIVKAGLGTLTLSGANVYTGLNTALGIPMTIVSGKVLGAADGAFPPSAAVTLGNATTGTNSLTATLDTGTFDEKIGSLLVNTTTAASSAQLRVGGGKTLTVNGNFDVQAPTANSTVTLNASGTGTLTVNNPAGNFLVDAAAVTPVTALVDFSGLANFNATVTTFAIGQGNGTAVLTAAMTLATTNTITASGNLYVSRSQAGAGGTSATLKLGQTNTINVGTPGTSRFFVGTDKASGAVTFNAGLTNPVLTLRGAAGGSAPADLFIGTQLVATGTTITGNVLLDAGAGRSDGSIDAILTTLKIGEGSNGATLGTGTGTLQFDRGTITATNVIVGSAVTGSIAGSTGTGTLNVEGGSLSVGAGGIILANKSGGAAPAVGTLNITGGTVTLGSAGITAGGAGTGTATSTLTLNGGTLDLNGNAIATTVIPITTLNFQSGTLKNVLAINGTAGLNKTTAGTLILEGTNSYTGATVVTAGTLQVGSGGTTGTLGTSVANIANSGTLAFKRSDAVSFGTVVTGTGSLAQNGPGKLTVTGANTFTGPAAVNGGILSVATLPNGGVNSPLGASTNAAANLLLNDTGTLQYTGATATTDRLFTVGSGATGGTLDASGTGALTMGNAGVVALGGNALDPHTLTLSGTSAPVVNNVLASQLTGNLSLVKDGANTWTLIGNSNYTGGTLVKNGVLQVGNGGTVGMILNDVSAMVTINSGATLAFNHSDSVTFAGTIMGAGGVENRGAGGLTLTNANNYSGITTIDSGSELTVTANGALGVSPAGTVVQSGGTLRLGVNYSTSEDLTIEGTGKGGAGALALALGTTAASFAGPITIGATGATINPTTNVPASTGTLALNGGINFATNNTTVTFTGVGNVVLGGGTTTSPGVIGNVVVDGVVVTFGGVSSHTGTTSITNAGTAIVGINNGVSPASSLTIGTNSTLDLNGFNQSLAGLTTSGTGTHVVTNNGATASTLSVTASSTFAGIIQNGMSATALNVSGAGTVFTPTAVNTYSGGTTINGGATLQISTLGNIGASTGAVGINAGTLQVLQDITTNRNFQLGSATSAVAVAATKTLSVSGVFSDGAGVGTLNKTGPGTLVLTGTNLYTGGTNIAGGIVQIGNNDATGSLGSGAISNAGTLNFTRTDTTTIAGAIGGSGTVNQTHGILNLNGAVTGQNLHAISGQVNLGAGDTGGTNPNHSLALLTIDDGSSVQLTLSGAQVVKASALSIPGTGFLDVTNNVFILDYAGATEIPAQTAAVAALLNSGFAGGAWNGPGINSSRATDFANNGSQGQYLTGVGYMSGALVSGSYLGRPVDAGSVITRYTYYGDADLNGQVNSADYTLIDSAYAALHDADTGTTAVINWVNGDFNYDGKIDGADYAMIDTTAAFTNGQPLPDSFIEAREQQFGPSYAAGLAAIQAVPEPASFGMLLLGGALLGLRRRRAKAEEKTAV